MNIDEAILSYIVKNNALAELQRVGLSEDDFVDEYRTVYRFLIKSKRDHDTTPSRATLRTRYPELRLPNVEKRDLPILLHQLRQRRKYKEFLTSLTDAAQSCVDFDAVDGSIQSLQSRLNQLGFGQRGQSHLVDLFSNKAKRQLLKEYDKRTEGLVAGMPTGLGKFDTFAGGLQKQKMVVIIGRTGIGKSWLDLLFVATSVMGGGKVILYPLEMNLFETATRLYTIFSQRMFGMTRVLRNYELTAGTLDKRKVVRFLNLLEDRFKGQLYVADVASLADPYTNERIEAEVDMHHPDMFWVDYLTLLKPPPRTSRDAADWSDVRQLSNGIKNTAMRRNVVGGCSAQVNREALRVKSFLPRLEHISYGDSIGQDADQVFSINRNEHGLYYALVKNRGGPEISKTKVTFRVNEGLLVEAPDQDDEED